MRKTIVWLMTGLMISSLCVLTAAADGGRATTAHAPITISTDAAFTTNNGVAGGDGTAASPFIIENWEITASVPSLAGILIDSTTKYFVVRNCVINAQGVIGISLANAPLGRVSGNTVTGGSVGIMVQNSGNCTVTDNKVSNGASGIGLQNSATLTVTNNNVTDITSSGFAIQNSGAGKYSGNTVGRVSDGMSVQNSNGNTLEYNVIHNSSHGITVQNAGQNTVTNNELRDCSASAVTVQNSNGNLFHHNKFRTNNAGAKQATDESGTNTWNDVAQGNYWSDWQTPDANSDGVVDQAYVLLGTTGAKDNFPLVFAGTGTGNAPGAPRELTTNASDSKVDLFWKEPATTGSSAITGYRIYRGTTSGSLSLLATIGVALAYTDTTVTNGAVYYYQLSAVNAAGESARTAESNGAPRAPPKPDLTVLDVSCNKLLPIDGNTVTITVKVKNVGTADVAAGVGVKIQSDGKDLSSSTLGAVPAGANATVTFSWKAVKGPHVIKAISDPGSTLSELSEVNNENTLTLVVSPKPAIPKGIIPGFELFVVAGAFAMVAAILRRREN